MGLRAGDAEAGTVDRADSLEGGAGNDTLVAGDGGDTVDGGDGDDSVTAGAGAETLAGGAGADTLSYAGATGGVVVDLVAETVAGTGAVGDVVSGFEAVLGGGFDDSLRGGDGANHLVGGAGNDTIMLYGSNAFAVDGGGGNDSVDGTDFADSFAGGDGADTLFGRDGANTLDGGAGNDRFTTQSEGRLFGGNGDDTLDGGFNSTALRGGVGADSLRGGDGNDTIVWRVGDGNDTVTLGSGTNRLELEGWTGPATPTTDGNHGDWAVDIDGATATFTRSAALGGGSVRVEDWAGAGGTNSVICFWPGTLIATPEGPRAVETLAIGDLVLTAEGKVEKVRWMGRQTVSTRFADPLRALPIRIAAGALGEGLPSRELLVSPDHALLLDGVLVQAAALVNGTTITREREVPEVFTYHHVELATHALILAEGVPAETFVDNAERLAFDNWAEHEALYGHLPPLEEMDLPRVSSARQLPAALRRRLATIPAGRQCDGAAA